MLHNMIKLVVIMRRWAALTVSCLSALVADGRPTQTACGAIDPNGRPTVANGRPAKTPCPSSPSERSIHFGQNSPETGQAIQKLVSGKPEMFMCGFICRVINSRLPGAATH